MEKEISLFKAVKEGSTRFKTKTTFGTTTLELVDKEKKLFRDLAVGNVITIINDRKVVPLSVDEKVIEGEILKLLRPDSQKVVMIISDGRVKKICKQCGQDFETKKKTNFCCIDHKRKYFKKKKEKKS